jgi:hypothetical protein
MDISAFPYGAQVCFCTWGIPVKLDQIDAMQLVMRKDLWTQVGGSSDQQKKGDGFMHEEVAKRPVIAAIPETLAGHGWKNSLSFPLLIRA